MFWKKKTSDKELFSLDSKTRRNSFRLDSRDGPPVFADFGGRVVRLLNISAGGVSFECDNCKKGDAETIRIELPGKNSLTIITEAEIIKTSEDTVCHCRFTEIPPDTAETIHQYVLHSQIAALRNTRSNKEKATCYHERKK